MTTPERVKHETLADAHRAVMEEIFYIQKTPNQQLGYAIIKEQDLLALVRPAMLKHGIACVPIKSDYYTHGEFVTQRGSRLTFVMGKRTFRFKHLDSKEFEDVEVLCEAMASGDTASYKACTMSKKMAMREYFMLEAGEDEADERALRDAENFDAYKRARRAILDQPTEEAADAKLEKVLSLTAEYQWTEDEIARFKKAREDWKPKDATKPQQTGGW